MTGPDLGLADALGTALAVAGEQGLARIDGLVGDEALVINPDGSERRTQGCRCREGHLSSQVKKENFPNGRWRLFPPRYLPRLHAADP